MHKGLPTGRQEEKDQIHKFGKRENTNLTNAKVSVIPVTEAYTGRYHDEGLFLSANKLGMQGRTERRHGRLRRRLEGGTSRKNTHEAGRRGSGNIGESSDTETGHF